MAELADALGLGPSPLWGLRVRVPPSAQTNEMSLSRGASQLLGLRGDEKRAAMGDERVGEEPSERRAASARAEARATCSRVPPSAQTNEMSLSKRALKRS